MSVTATIVNDAYSGVSGDQRRNIDWLLSFTNPYTVNGEVSNIWSGYAKKQFLGAWVTMVNPSVTAALTAKASNLTVWGDTNSTNTVTIKLYSLPMAGAGLGELIDNSVANISGLSIYMRTNSK